MKTQELNHTLINQWVAEKRSSHEIENTLANLGYDADLIAAYLQSYTKMIHAKRRNLGFILVIVGSVLGFLSCVLTMVDILPAFSNFCLYGLTSFGVTLAFVGLYFIFE